MHRAGFALFQSLSSEQKSDATLWFVPGDIETGPSRDGRIPEFSGAKVLEMTETQQRLLLDTIQLWVSIQPDENVVKRMEEIESELAATYFTWKGSGEINTPTYMRIHGPSLIIELLSTGGNFGANADGLGHYHTIYRNPKNEYGRAQ